MREPEDSLLLPPFAAFFFCDFRRTKEMWQKRVRVEPLILGPGVFSKTSSMYKRPYRTNFAPRTGQFALLTFAAFSCNVRARQTAICHARCRPF